MAKQTFLNLPEEKRIKIFNSLKKEFNRVALKDTGEWYKSLRLIYDVDGFYLTSTDDKNKYLKDKYGPKILKLTKENLKNIIYKYIRPELSVKLKEYLQNGTEEE